MNKKNYKNDSDSKEYTLSMEWKNLSGEICRKKIPYTIVRSKRRSYGITVDENAIVTLRIPIRGSERTAIRLAEDKKEWILQKVRLQMERQKKRERMEDEASNRFTPEQRAALEKRYRMAAKEYFPKRVEYFSKIIGVKYGKIRIAEQKTRWGSCSSSGTLSFNWKLMLAPPKVLDYVVVHELCHLLEMNHSQRFWAQVEKIIPEYKEYKKWLRENGSSLLLF